MTHAESLTLPPEQLARWSLEEYRGFVDSGALNGRRVELIAGQIVEMSPTNDPHKACVASLLYDFGEILGNRFLFWVQQGVALPSFESEPEPDLAIVDYREDRYAFGAPEANDIRLLVEVADSSLDYDRETKAPLYAKAGIREYWIVNLKQRRLERYVSPEGALAYPKPEILAEGASFTHELLGGLSVEDLLPMTAPAA